MSDTHPSIRKLYSLELFGIKLGLQNLAELLQRLENPQDGLKFIHVAGTNGKGSVCAILSKSLQGANFNVGFFSSPHLVTIRERFRFNNRGITETELTSFIDEIWPHIDALYAKDVKITFFEATVAIALLYYKKKNCDFVVWETGMGGRLDGTNIVNPILTAITTINYDHQQYLGDTLEKIAYEKAGIIKKGVPLFTGDILESPLKLILERADKLGCKTHLFDDSILHFQNSETYFKGLDFSIKDSPEIYRLSTNGVYQKKNLALALSLISYLSKIYKFDISSALSALKDLKWHARCQLLPDGKILDGAHNQEGIEALVSSMKNSFHKDKFTVIFGCLEERNPTNVIKTLSSIAEKFIFTGITTNRKSCEPIKIINLMKNSIGFSTECSTAQSPKEALRLAGNSKTLIAGSLYLAGEILREYYTEDYITII